MIDTKIYRVNNGNSDIEELKIASKVLRDGGTVAFPTETVYGLGANAFCEDAIKKIFQAKGRPQDNPLICHIPSFDKLSLVAKDIPKLANELAKKFWPGPLTMVLSKKDAIADAATCGLDTVGVRVPAHAVALKLLELSDVPVVAPSANLSGKPSPTRASHVIDDMFGRVDVIVDGGNCKIGIESTVLDMTVNPPVVLRPGAVTLDMLREIEPGIELFFGHAKESEESGIKSPGLKHRHYAPSAPLFLVDGDFERQKSVISKIVAEAKLENRRIGLILTREMIEYLQLVGCSQANLEIVDVGSRSNLREIAKNLFAALRFFSDVDEIISESYSESDSGLAIMNRLIRASGGKYL